MTELHKQAPADLSSEASSVGVIGLGKLGWEIAARLIDAGKTVVGYKRSGLDAFVSRGGIAAESAADVARQCKTVLVCLPGEAALNEVVNGNAGLARSTGPGSIVVELSTFSPQAKEEARQSLKKTGATMLDCTISGKPAALATGKATLFVSGDREAIQNVMGTLEIVCPQCVQMGAFGAATRMKLVTNMLMTINCMAAAEVLNIANAMGFEPEFVAEALKCSGAASAQLAIRAPIIAHGAKPNPTAIAGIKKDISLINEMVSDLSASTPLFDRMRDIFNREATRHPDAGDISLLFSDALRRGRQDYN